MTFYDADSVWKIPDVVRMISENDFGSLHMQEPERRIRFKPVITHPKKPVDIAFIGLKAYCGDDYRKVVRLPNFFVWAQHEEGFSKTMKPVMDIYCSALRLCEFGEGRAYYTNYLKVVPPSKPFGSGGGSALKAALDQTEQLRHLSRQWMCDEIKTLVADGCQTFVCFGDVAADYFQSAVFKGLECTIRTTGSKFRTFEYEGEKCLIVWAVHFGARCAVETESIELAAEMCRQLKRME